MQTLTLYSSKDFMVLLFDFLLTLLSIYSEIISKKREKLVEYAQQVSEHEIRQIIKLSLQMSTI